MGFLERVFLKFFGSFGVRFCSVCVIERLCWFCYYLGCYFLVAFFRVVFFIFFGVREMVVGIDRRTFFM